MTEIAADAAVVASNAASSHPSAVTTLGMLQKQNGQPRRLRPPVVLVNTATRDEPRVPLRQESREELRTNSEKVSRRESRVNLRGLFSRSKTSGQDARASIADFGNWPPFYPPWVETAHAKNAPPQSLLPRITQEQSLPPQQPVATAPALQEQLLASQPIEPTHLSTSSTARPKRPTASLRSRTPGPSARATARDSLATWDPPPLFQAYPQAVKHAQLPICTTPIDALKRLQAAITDGSRAEAIGSLKDRPSVADKTVEKPKRRHRRNASDSSIKLEWGSKIYVLVTSGYLLQYAAEGSFDRLPEKILPISHESAAFASDLIPGCHWVLRICASTNAEGVQALESRSIFSRFPFRGSERRHASTFLMVFNGAEEMEAWITVLRREIEQLGGKKHLSETGKPKAEQVAVNLRSQVSQRNLVVRDPERFSRVLNPGDVSRMIRCPPSQINTQAAHPRLSQHLQAPALLHEREAIGDDTSTTTSVYSQDDRQLESLRGGTGNRNSYISTGQRTVMTSDSSSPPSSPVRGSFLSNDADEEEKHKTSPATSPAPVPVPVAKPTSALIESPKSRPRPNAAAISERRQSMQLLASSQRLTDVRLLPMQLPSQQAPLDEASQRPEASISSYNTLPTIPNFSVPHLGSTRYSAVITHSSASGLTPYTVSMQEPQYHTNSVLTRPPRDVLRNQPPLIPPAVRNNRRRLPPPSLASSRPLSVVTDQATFHIESPYNVHEEAAVDTPLCNRNMSSPCHGSEMSDTPALNTSWKSFSSGDTMSPSSAHSPHSSLQWPSERFSSPSVAHESNDARFSGRNAVSEAQMRAGPRRQSSMLSLRSTGDACASFEGIAAPQRNSIAWPVSRYNAISPQLPDNGRAAWSTRPSSSHSRPQLRATSMPRQSMAPPTSSGSNWSFTGHGTDEYRRPGMFVRPGTSNLDDVHITSDSKPFATSTSMPSVYPTSIRQSASTFGGAVSSDTDRGRSEVKLEQQASNPSLSAPTSNMTIMSRDHGVHVRGRSLSTSKANLSRPDEPQLANGLPPLPPPTSALPPPLMPPPTCALPPPPAPPPTRALPPLPAKVSVGQAV
ncbi:hypothetical protein SEPCBS57363_004243 [Sporothrix epigloea]|uniref:Peptidase family m20 m25 m40 protein n=1 Tax=Sporothrix epigloea TaxID=1892477 RepID=A0ABP0DT32_9PEZI